MSDFIVCPTEPCVSHDNGLYDGAPCVALSKQLAIPTRGRCEGCLRNGRRAVLGEATPVEPVRSLTDERPLGLWVTLDDEVG